MTEKSLTFGRGPGADVTVDDKYVSPRHCRVTQIPMLTGYRYQIEDLGSTNGTWIYSFTANLITPVATIRVGTSPVILKPTDVVRIGRTILPKPI